MDVLGSQLFIYMINNINNSPPCQASFRMGSTSMCEQVRQFQEQGQVTMAASMEGPTAMRRFQDPRVLQE